MAASNLKLTYFDLPGRAEQTRMALAFGNIVFEDERLSFDQYRETKASLSLPLGQLPVLYVDGKPLAQSNAMFRYAGKQAGLYPRDDDFKAAQIDMVCDTLSEVLDKIIVILFALKDEEEKAKHTEKLLAEEIPKRFEALSKYKTGNFMIGDEPTLADIKLYDVSTFLPKFPTFELSKYPELADVVSKVKALPQLANYFERVAGN